MWKVAADSDGKDSRQLDLDDSVIVELWSKMAGKVAALMGKVTIEPCIMLFALGNTLISVQMSKVQIEKTCKVGSYFFSNGTTYGDEVRKFVFKTITVFGASSFSSICLTVKKAPLILH